MRTADRPVPVMVPHPVPPDAPIAAWPAALRVGIERAAQVPYLWDMGQVWDDPNPALVWDAAQIPAQWVDAVCDFQAMSIDHGAPDDNSVYPASQLTLTLANETGVWSTWTTAGRLVDFPIGSRVAVWTVLAGVTRWLFAGRTTLWHQDATTVVVEAFDAFAQLAPDWGAPWTPGAANDYPLARLQAIAVQSGWPDPVTGDRGDLQLAAPLEDADVSPLEAMERAALSDGGVVAVDPDGRIVYRDRRWRNGPADQPRVDTFTDNACQAGALVVWDAVAGADDDGATTQVRLTNTAGDVVVATTAGLVPLRLTHPTDDLWQTVAAGQALADWLLANGTTAGYRVESFALHLTDPTQPDLWPAALELRRGDRFGWVTDTFGPNLTPTRLDVDVIAVAVRHDITPDDWQTTVNGSRAVRARTAILWDQTIYVWDDPNPDATWRP